MNDLPRLPHQKHAIQVSEEVGCKVANVGNDVKDIHVKVLKDQSLQADSLHSGWIYGMHACCAYAIMEMI